VSSQVRNVNGEERVSEIARMLGGEKLSAATLAHAREMLGDTPLPPQNRITHPN
jgi:DNA repair protein RecN (Recombination protein N)